MKSLLFGVITYFPLFVVGQPKLINRDLTNSDTSLLYAGTENHLTFTGLNDLSGIRIRSSNKSHVSVQANDILIRPATSTEFDTLSIFKGKKLLLTKAYKIERLSYPIAQLAFTSDTTISLNRILANPFITTKIPNTLYKPDIRIQHFDCHLYTKKVAHRIFSTTGNKLSEEMIAAIKRTSSKDEIIFENIVVGIAP